jgi:hypothetical protein
VNALPAGTKKLLVVAVAASEKYSPVESGLAAIVTLLLAAVRVCDCAEPESATDTLVLLARLVPVGFTVAVTFAFVRRFPDRSRDSGFVVEFT